MNDEMDFMMEPIPAKKKGVGRKIIAAIFSALSPILLLVFAIVILGSGVFGAFSMVGGFVSGLFGDSSLETLQEKAAGLNDLTDEEILELVKSDKIDESFYETMMISQEEFQYLLEQVIAYNTQSVERTIEIECEHRYTEWVEDETLPMGGYSIPRVEYEYRPITVRSSDIERFYLDWQLVYALCLTDTMKGVESWQRLPGIEEEKKGTLIHYGSEHEEIDYILSHVQMNYEYVTDLARSPKASYSMEECKALVHTTYEYGDESTSEGAWKYYYPHSVLRRAYSGYSCMYYLLSEDQTMLTNFICASDVNHFERIIERFCPRYNFGYFSVILGFIPGGEDIQERLESYYANKETGLEILDEEIHYEIGSGIDKSLLPTSTERLETEFGDLTDYGDLIYDESVGGNIVREAMSKIGCLYDQNRRWEEGVYDCSSFIWRILSSVGIDLSKICAGSTAAEECRGMVDAGMTISPQSIQQGDIIFYSGYVNGRYRNITHVAIYAGDGKIVHAANKRDGVKIGNFYRTGLVCICRPYKAIDVNDN